MEMEYKLLKVTISEPELLNKSLVVCIIELNRPIYYLQFLLLYCLMPVYCIKRSFIFPLFCN